MPLFENNNILHVLNFDQAYMSIFKLAYKVSQRRNVFYFFPCQSNINFHFFKFFKFYSVTFCQQLLKGDMVWNLDWCAFRRRCWRRLCVTTFFSFTFLRHFFFFLFFNRSCFLTFLNINFFFFVINDKSCWVFFWRRRFWCLCLLNLFLFFLQFFFFLEIFVQIDTFKITRLIIIGIRNCLANFPAC